MKTVVVAFVGKPCPHHSSSAVRAGKFVPFSVVDMYDYKETSEKRPWQCWIFTPLLWLQHHLHASEDNAYTTLMVSSAVRYQFLKYCETHSNGYLRISLDLLQRWYLFRLRRKDTGISHGQSENGVNVARDFIHEK
jgi:hypothetical protein